MHYHFYRRHDLFYREQIFFSKNDKRCIFTFTFLQGITLAWFIDKYKYRITETAFKKSESTSNQI